MVPRRRSDDDRRARAEAFIAERAPGVAGMSNTELDELTRRAMANVDDREILGEIEALRESWKAKPAPRALPQ